MDIEAAQEAMVKAGIWSLVEAVLADERFSLADLLGKDRKPVRLRKVRHRLWATAFDMKDVDGKRLYSYPDLGRLFNRDHSTIISGVAEHKRTKPLPKRKTSKKVTEALRKIRVAQKALAEAEQALLR